MKFFLLFALSDIFRNDEKPFGILSNFEADYLKSLKKSFANEDDGVRVNITLDLGRSRSELFLSTQGLSTKPAENAILTWDEIHAISKKEGVYAVYNDGSKPWRVSTMSPTSNIPASLLTLSPNSPPTIVLG